MVKITSQSGHTTYGLKEFVLTKPEDYDNLPVDVAIGSTAFLIPGSIVYMFDGEGWLEI